MNMELLWNDTDREILNYPKKPVQRMCFLFTDMTMWQFVRRNLQTTEVVTSEKFTVSYKISCSLLCLRYNIEPVSKVSIKDHCLVLSIKWKHINTLCVKLQGLQH
jgi:hypothetical protein